MKKRVVLLDMLESLCWWKLGIENKIQMSIFRLLSSILHLGNVVIDEGERDTTFIKESDKSFSTFCLLTAKHKRCVGLEKPTYIIFKVSLVRF